MGCFAPRRSRALRPIESNDERKAETEAAGRGKTTDGAADGAFEEPAEPIEKALDETKSTAAAGERAGEHKGAARRTIRAAFPIAGALSSE